MDNAPSVVLPIATPVNSQSVFTTGVGEIEVDGVGVEPDVSLLKSKSSKPLKNEVLFSGCGSGAGSVSGAPGVTDAAGIDKNGVFSAKYSWLSALSTASVGLLIASDRAGPCPYIWSSVPPNTVKWLSS
jgi:hypothetical protein